MNTVESCLQGWAIGVLLVIVLALLGDKIDRRAQGLPEAAVALPAQWPVCPRLQSMTGRVDIVVIDHVLVYRCTRT